MSIYVSYSVVTMIHDAGLMITAELPEYAIDLQYAPEIPLPPYIDDGTLSAAALHEVIDKHYASVQQKALLELQALGIVCDESTTIGDVFRALSEILAEPAELKGIGGDDAEPKCRYERVATSSGLRAPTITRIYVPP